MGKDPRITVFRGVPYAKPPVGALRWKAPQPAEDWTGVRKCYEYGDMIVIDPVKGHGLILHAEIGDHAPFLSLRRDFRMRRRGLDRSEEVL